MGLEAKCTVRHAGRASEGKAHLESKAIEFRGEFKLKIPLGSIASAEAKQGDLIVESPEGRAVFALGKDAEKWALKIRYPKSRIDKLGVKAGHRVFIDGLQDGDLDHELAQAGADVAGLVDVKVCSFSDTHTALKAMVPVSRRAAR